MGELFGHLPETPGDARAAPRDARLARVSLSRARERALGVMSPPPTRGREGEDVEQPNKARRIVGAVDARATPLRAFASREDARSARMTPDGSVTSASRASAPDSASVSMSASRADAENDEEIDDGRFDPAQALEEYDREISTMSQSLDEEEAVMEEADRARREQHRCDSVDATDGWNVNFKAAVHEAGRRLFARSFQSERSIEEAIQMCFSADESQTRDILAEFDVPSSFNISYKHVMGEALELMVCYLSRVETRVDLRDYLAEKQYEDEDGEPIVTFVECEVYKCFMSSAPPGSPFRMTREDLEDLATAFGGSEDAWQLADRLFDQSRFDRFFDVLVILKDLENAGRYHIQAIQCKARTQFDAYIDISKYVGHQFAIYEMASKLNALVCLDWVSNVILCKQVEEGGDFQKLRETGHLRTFLYADMCHREDNIRLAAAMASHAFDSKDGEIVPKLQRKPPREFQTQAVERLRVEREDLKASRGTIVAATGTGKSRIAFMDAMATMYDVSGNALTLQDQIALVWACPRILLLEQTAENFKAYEDCELAEFAEHQAGFKIPKLFYYLVCSKTESFDTPNPNTIRRINAPQLFNTLLLHASRGELSRCRFFTTVEGGSGFWYQLCKYIRVSRGVQEPFNNRENPLVNVFIVDEAHEVTGNSGGVRQLTLNIPAKWRVCYSATPFVEHYRAEFIRAHVEGNESDDDDDAAFEDMTETVAKRKSRKKSYQTPEERFPSEFFSKLTDLNINETISNDPVNEIVEDVGLCGFQLLSDNLQFVPLDSAARLPQFQSADATELIQQLQDVASRLTSGPSVDDFSEVLGGRQVVIFETRKERYRGMCTCRRELSARGGSQCKQHCAAVLFPQESATVDMYKCNFDYWYRNFIAYDVPVVDDDDQKMSTDCVVLGWDKETQVLSVRLGGPHGFACHDFTDFGTQNGTNLIGAPTFTYTFSEAFRSTHNILARPFLLTYRLKVPSEPMNDARHERMKRIFGISAKQGTRGLLLDCKPLNKVGLQINFEVADSPITATTQDYATAVTIYRMIEQREASKIMVFCARNEDCRRCLALLHVLLRQRIEDAKSRGDEDLVRHLSDVRAAHIFSTWERKGTTEEMEERVKLKLLHQFKMGKIEVLFNVNYLSTGLDIPCTDAVVLTSKSAGKTTLLQRWGRALRSIANQPGKRGILALIASDPRESTDDRNARCNFMGLKPTQKKDFGGCQREFREMYSLAECATHHSNRIIGECEKIKPGRTTKRKVASKERKQTSKSSTFPKVAVTIEPGVERMLCDMFDISLRNLLQD